MKLKQLSLFLENKPGALSAPVRVLAGANVNILTLSIAEGRQYGILRLIVGDAEAAKKILEKHGLVVKVTEVLAIEVPDHPGGLAGILGALEVAGLNLEYMYAFPFKRESKGFFLFSFDDPDKAIHVLQKNKINVVGIAELCRRLEG
jgi:hypothetical protein